MDRPSRDAIETDQNLNDNLRYRKVNINKLWPTIFSFEYAENLV